MLADCAADVGQARGGAGGLGTGKDKGIAARIAGGVRCDRGDFCPQADGGTGQRRIGGRGDKLHAKTQRFHLVAGQGNRRQGDGRGQDIAHPPLALDWQPRGDKRGHVAPDRAGRHLQRCRHVGRTVQLPVTQDLDQVEKAVTAAHGTSLRCAASGVNGRSAAGPARGASPCLQGR